MNKNLGIFLPILSIGCLDFTKPQLIEGACEERTRASITKEDADAVAAYFTDPPESIYHNLDIGESIQIGVLAEASLAEMSLTQLVTDMVETSVLKIEANSEVCISETFEEEEIIWLQMEAISEICTNYCFHDTLATEIQVYPTGEMWLLRVEPTAID